MSTKTSQQKMSDLTPNLTFVIDDKLLSLCKHALSSKAWQTPYGADPAGKGAPGLMLIKDDGIYLMSNGLPIFPYDRDKRTHVAYSVEADAFTNPDSMAVYDTARRIMGGDDCIEHLVDLPEQVLDAHAKGKNCIEFEVNADQIKFQFSETPTVKASLIKRRPRP